MQERFGMNVVSFLGKMSVLIDAEMGMLSKKTRQEMKETDVAAGFVTAKSVPGRLCDGFRYRLSA